MKKTKRCPWCGKKFSKSGKYCSFEHGYNAMVEARRQLMDKEGPVYEKWKERLKASIERL